MDDYKILIRDMTLSPLHKTIIIGNTPVKITRKEFDILYYLISNSDRTVTHKELLTTIWGAEFENDTQLLWRAMNRLRNKLSEDNDKYIKIERGVGYRFSIQ